MSIDCPLSPGPSRWFSRESVATAPPATVCAACPCPTQVEWSAEARYVREYVEQLHEALFRQAACDDPRRFSQARHLAMDPQRTWTQRWALMQGNSRWRQQPAEPWLQRDHSREGFVSVLFAQNAKLDQVLLHTEAIRTLAYSAWKHCLHKRPYVVITDGPLPEVASAALKADGLSIIEAKDELQGTYGANMREDLQLDSWWMERGVAPTSIKLAVWNMTHFDRLLFLDADTLILGPCARSPAAGSTAPGPDFLLPLSVREAVLPAIGRRAGHLCIWIEPLLRAWDDRDRKRAVEIQEPPWHQHRSDAPSAQFRGHSRHGWRDGIRSLGSVPDC